jgi:hypothetical protein
MARIRWRYAPEVGHDTWTMTPDKPNRLQLVAQILRTNCVIHVQDARFRRTGSLADCNSSRGIKTVSDTIRIVDVHSVQMNAR